MKRFIKWLIDRGILVPRMNTSFVYSASQTDYYVQMKLTLNPELFPVLIGFGVGVLMGVSIGFLIF